MLDLECLLKEKYLNLDFNILYIDFKHHDIPANSNIINIILHSTHLYDVAVGSPYENLRIYCGRVLAQLFGTELIFGYDRDIFNN